MGDKKKGKQIDFIVSTGDPNSASNSANKKRVRSVAALKSWPERRRKIFEQLESSGTGFLVSEPEPKRKASGLAKKARKDADVEQIAGPPPPPALPTRSLRSSPVDGLITPPPSQYDPGSSIALYHQALTRVPSTPSAVSLVHSVHGSTPCLCSQCQRKRRATNVSIDANRQTQLVAPVGKKRMADGSEKTFHFMGDMAMITPPASPDDPARGQADPFNCYPVPFQPWFDHVLHHMMTVYAPRGWPALKITDDQGVKWEWFMTQNALSEPALFYVRLLFGSGDMIRLGTLKPEIQFWLRAQAIKAINSALADNDRACSDALILAVGRIALHEHMYGDKYASSHVHRPAQKRMIELRGGMKALGFPDLVKRLMRWSDRIMAVGSGTERLLEDEDSNPNFTLRQSVGAIEHWAPHEMPGVRSKIKISDLVNEDDSDEDGK